MNIELIERATVAYLNEPDHKTDPVSQLEAELAGVLRVAIQACAEIAAANCKDKEYGHAAFRCVQIEQQIRALLADAE